MDVELEPATLAQDAARVAAHGGAAEGAAPPPPAPAPSSVARGAALSGLVVAPDGAPVADAEVALGTLPELVATKRSAGLRTAKTDGEGRFVFDSVADQAVRLTAAHVDFAPSETSAVQLAGRASEDELVLRLRRGAVVRGEVFRPDRAPAVARRVQLASDFGGGARVVVTDERGMFTIPNVTPGRWSVATYPGKEEMAALGALGFQGMDMSYMRQKMFELADGDDVFVSLGAPSAQAVRVFGRVTSGGEPRVVLMQWLSERSRSLELQKVTEAAADGTFEVLVDEPGPYLVRLSPRGWLGASVDELIDVPRDVTELRHDIALAATTVRGIVRDVDGAPLAGMTVSYRCVRGPWRGPLTTMLALTATEDDGTFELLGLPPGAWSFSASRPFAENEEERRFAPVPSPAVELTAGAVVEGLELRVAAGGPISGRCVDDLGLGVSGAAVLVFAPDGRPLQGYTRGASRADGTFSGPVVGPGAHTVIAVHGVHASEPATLQAALDDRTPLELRLAPAAMLIVRFATPSAAWETSVDVVDAGGRAFKDLVPHSTSQLDNLAGYRPSEQRFGPLPPGKYTVRLDIGAAHEVTLAPGEDLVLEVGA